MTDLNPGGPRRRKISIWLSRTLVVGLIVAVLPSAPAADDAYLRLLDEEVTKVNRSPTDTGVDDIGSSADPVPERTAQPGPSREKFESLLKRKHVGTYSFYRRLPERTREEIFVDFTNGASLEDLREKIVDRYLQR